MRDLLIALPGISQVLCGDDRREIGLDHPRAGDLVALSESDSWFAYLFWLDDRAAPDFARTVDIHRKPGYDPCELFFDPSLWWPKGRAMRRLAQKKLGFRALFDVIPLDPRLSARQSWRPGRTARGSPPLDRRWHRAVAGRGDRND